MKSLKTAGTENRRGLIWISVLAALFAALFLAWPGGSLPVHADDQAVIRKIGSFILHAWRRLGLPETVDTVSSSYSFGAAYDYQYLDSPHKFRVVEAVQSIALEDSRISLAPGGSAKLNWKILPSDPYTEALALEDLTFSSSNPSAVTVDEEGNVKGIAYGTAVITVRSANGAANGIQAACTVTVARPGVTGIRLNKTKATLDAGDTLQLTGTISPGDADEALTWSSSNASVASVSSSGKVTAKGSGTARITAKAGSATAVCTVTVRKAPESVKLGNSKVTMTEGAAKTLKATLSPSGSRTSLTWKSSNTKVAQVSDSGRVTAKAKGTATITVTTGNGKKATCKVTVKAPSPKSIKLSSKTLKLETGGKKRLTYTFSPENAQGKVTWKSSKPSVASVNSKGLITAKSVGKTTITARVSSKVTARCTVTVAKKPSSIKLKKTSLTLKRGSTAKLSYSFSPSNSYATVKWSSSSKAVTVKSDGTIAAKAIGRAKITARTSNGKKASCTVKVTAPDAKSIKLKTTSATVEKGGTLKLSYALNPSDAAGKVKWSTSNKKVAIVNSKGQVTAKASGTATITAKISSKVSAKCKITVPVRATGIAVTDSIRFVSAGETINLTAKLTPSNAVDKVTWISSNSSVASVDGNGKVTGKKAGIAEIRAVAGKYEAACTVQVTEGLWLDISEGVISVYGGNRVSQGATRNGVYGFEYYTYDTDTGVTIVQSNKDKSYNLDIGQHMDTTDGEKIRVILGGAKIDWLSIWSNDKVILEAMEGTENTIHGIGYSCQDDASSLTITGEGALSIQNETGPAIAVSKNLTITAGNLTVQTASDTCPVIGRSVTSTTKDRTIENIKVLSGAKVTAVGGCKAVGIAGEDTTEKGIFIAPGTLSYRKNG